MKKQLAISGVVLFALISSTAYAQTNPRRSDPHTTYYPSSLTAWQVANRFWNTHTTKCGDSLYYLRIEVKYDNQTLFQGKNPTITIDVNPGRPLTEADRLNGVIPIEQKGTTTITFSSNRLKGYKDQGRPISDTWNNWSNGGSVTVFMQKKKGGQWEVSDCMYIPGPFCQQIKAIPCAEINGPTPDRPTTSTNKNAPQDRPTVRRRRDDNSPLSFFIIFEQDDTGNKRRDWSRSGNTWTERYVDGRFHEFRILGRSTVDNCGGTIAQKVEDGAEIFIPDKGCEDMTLRYRYQTKHWGPLGQMQDIR